MPDTNLALLAAHLNVQDMANTTVYILQEFIVAPNSAAVLMHSDDYDMLFEVRTDGHTYLYSVNRTTGRIETREPVTRGASITDLEQRFNVEKIASIQKDIADSVDFPINTEGFYDNNTYQIVQLRRTPIDALVKHNVNQLGDYPQHTHLTRLVMGHFEAEGILISTAEANENADRSEPLLVVRTEDTLPWTEPYFMHRFTQNLETIIIDMVNPSVIGHGPNDIPNDLNIRAYLKRIGMPGLQTGEELYNKHALVKSDGASGFVIL